MDKWLQVPRMLAAPFNMIARSSVMLNIEATLLHIKLASGANPVVFFGFSCFRNLVERKKAPEETRLV